MVPVGLVAVLLASALTQAGCTAMLLGGSGQGSPTRPVATLADSVAEKISADSTLAGVSVSGTNGGLITLRGRVATRAAKQRAESLARSVAGVTDVDNRLVFESG